tara:strand:- start:684 stop:917 length:234 start_codon:yes stop_codon:yes gene_type:complete
VATLLLVLAWTMSTLLRRVARLPLFLLPPRPPLLTTLLSVAAVVRVVVVLRAAEAQVVIALVGITKHLVAEAQAKLV